MSHVSNTCLTTCTQTQETQHTPNGEGHVDVTRPAHSWGEQNNGCPKGCLCAQPTLCTMGGTSDAIMLESIQCQEDKPGKPPWLCHSVAAS
jgi:hypothetical protein